MTETGADVLIYFSLMLCVSMLLRFTWQTSAERIFIQLYPHFVPVLLQPLNVSLILSPLFHPFQRNSCAIRVWRAVKLIWMGWRLHVCLRGRERQRGGVRQNYAAELLILLVSSTIYLSFICLRSATNHSSTYCIHLSVSCSSKLPLR